MEGKRTTTRAVARFNRKAFDRFCKRAATMLESDGRFLGLLAGGSFVGNRLDKYSDLDLVLVVEDATYDDVLASRIDIAGRLGHLMYAFTGEHVGEPRLLICLYGDPMMHVDLKFVTPDDLATGVEAPEILWDFDGRIAKAVARQTTRWPTRDPEWFEARFWVWIHYAASKFGRGELLEAIDSLSFIRAQVLGPMVARRVGAPERGVRHLERIAPQWTKRLAATVAGHSAASCAAAMRRTIELYRELRTDQPPRTQVARSERAVIRYVDATISRALK